jgi:AcrR family transcriptional regulator
MSTKAEQSEATRAALIGVARRRFAERGYARVSTEEIVRDAGVTRGALYHHFDGKRDLFRAVFEEVERELSQKIAERALTGSEPLQALEAGAAMFLDSAGEPEVRQIALIDAPSVLGWEEWREIGMRYGLGLVQAALQAAMDAGAIAEQPVRPLGHMLLGALDEAAMLVALAEDPAAAREEVGNTVGTLLDGLRVRHGP